jgi:hypothetical protein
MEAVIAGWQQRIAVQSGTFWTQLQLATGAKGVTPSIQVFALGTSPSTEVTALLAAIGRTPVATTTTTYTHLQALQLVAGCAGYTDTQCQLMPAGKLTRRLHVSGSDILGRALATSEISAIATYLRTRAKTNTSTTLIWEPLGAAVGAKAAADTAFPWRTALTSVQWKVVFSSTPTSAAETATYNWITTGHTKFGTASVGGYINYLEPSRQLSSYYGSNYTRLRQLRTKYDPKGLFHGKYVISAA